MSKNTKINKNRLTVFSIWDQIIIPERAYDVDIFIPSMPYVFSQESFFNDTPTPEEWWDFKAEPNSVCLHPERVTPGIYIDSKLLPVAVLEIYGVSDSVFPPNNLASLFYGGLLHFNPGMHPVSNAYGFKEGHKILLVELPLSKINETLDVMITKLPPGLVNQVIRDYKQIGEYTQIK